MSEKASLMQKSAAPAELLQQELAALFVQALNLETAPKDIDPDAALYGEGLGLDSLDALQLAMSVEERFGVSIPEGPEARPIFASVDALVAHICSCASG